MRELTLQEINKISGGGYGCLDGATLHKIQGTAKKTGLTTLTIGSLAVGAITWGLAGPLNALKAAVIVAPYLGALGYFTSLNAWDIYD